MGLSWFIEMKVLVVQQLSLEKMDSATRVHVLNEAVCISYSAYTTGKDMIPIILPIAMDK